MAQRLCRLVVVTLVLCSSASLAMPIGPPVQNLKTFEGRAEMRSEGGQVTVRHLGSAGETLQRFKIELSGDAELPASLDIEAAQILLWEGNLVVIAPQDGQAFHFAIPTINRQARRLSAQRRLPLTVNPEALDSDLGQRYALTRIEAVTSIVSVGGPAALLPEADATLERESRKAGIGISEDIIPADGGGISSCGVSCEIECANGSRCTVSCGQRQCATCRCPALCQCS